MTFDLPTAPPFPWPQEGPGGGAVDKSYPASHTKIRTVPCGRIAFWFYGTVLIIIGGLAAYFDPMAQAVIASVIIVWGITMVILGYVLPPKLVAHLGILLPW
jgi:hypothetical protein